jgi:hypothetical protein
MAIEDLYDKAVAPINRGWFCDKKDVLSELCAVFRPCPSPT